MISSGDLPARRRACRSRIFRTISTARILGAFMSGDLPGREDVQYSVPRFYVDGIEQANLIESNDVPEVPTDKRIDVGNRGQMRCASCPHRIWTPEFCEPRTPPRDQQPS